MSRKPRNSAPSNTSSVTPDRAWPTRSGKPLWRAGKKGLRRLQPELPVLRLCRQIPVLPTAAAADGAWRGAAGAGLLLLPALPSEFRALRRGAGAGRRDQSGAAALGVLGGQALALRRRRRGCGAAVCGVVDVG